MHKPSCFADLSRTDLAHVKRCQQIALERRITVVSSGVFAAEAGAELAGLHFWLVASPVAPASAPVAPVLVWLSGGRLLCGCKRRRSDGALTCCHAQAVRLWLLALAAGGVTVRPLVGATAPTPAPVDPAPVAEVPEWKRYSFTHDDTDNYYYTCKDGQRLVYTSGERAGEMVRTYDVRLAQNAVDLLPSWLLTDTAPAPAPDPDPDPAPVDPAPVAPITQAEPEYDGEPVCPCPGCEELAPVGVLINHGVCLACLDLMAEAEHTRIIRCVDCGQQAAVAETANGAFCQDCITKRIAWYGPETGARVGASLA